MSAPSVFAARLVSLISRRKPSVPEPTARHYIASVVDEDILPDAVIAMNNGHSPHLASQKSQTLHDRVGKSVESDLMRATRVIGCVRLLLDPLVPIVSVAVQCPDTMPIDADVVTTNYKRRRLVLVSNRERRVQPVLNVGAPL